MVRKLVWWVIPSLGISVETMDNRVALEVPGLDMYASEDLELGKGLAMTDSEVTKHPMDNKFAVMVNHSRVAHFTV